MQAKSIAECSRGGGGHSAMLSTFINLPVVIKTFVFSVFECPFYAGFTVVYDQNIFCSFCQNIYYVSVYSKYISKYVFSVRRFFLANRTHSYVIETIDL